MLKNSVSSVVETILLMTDSMQGISHIDLRAIEVDDLKPQLEFLFVRQDEWSGIIHRQKLFRSVRCKSRPIKVQDLSYPPADCVHRYGRCNRPSQSVFYAANSLPASLYELGVEAGDYVAVGQWKLPYRLLYYLGIDEIDRFLFYDGPIEEVRNGRIVFDTLKKHEAYPSLYKHNIWRPKWRTATQFARLWMMSQFARPVEPGKEHEFKLTVAIVEKIRDLITMKLSHSSDHGRFGGIVFPSLNFQCKDSNIVLFPELVKDLSLHDVIYLRVDKANPGLTYQVTQLDYADRVTSDHDIVWTGDRPWRLGSGPEAKFSLEYGTWLGRDTTGRKIGYSKRYHDGWDELI